MNNPAEVYGVFAFVVGMVVMIAGLFLFLLPFFVFKIRNQIIEMNKKMSQVIKLLGGRVDGSKYKICKSCQTKNSPVNNFCMGCGKPL